MVSQPHQLLLELIPGGPKKCRSAAQAKEPLAGVRPRNAISKLGAASPPNSPPNLEPVHLVWSSRFTILISPLRPARTCPTISN